jgi:hypothetical protein
VSGTGGGVEAVGDSRGVVAVANGNVLRSRHVVDVIKAEQSEEEETEKGKSKPGVN